MSKRVHNKKLKDIRRRDRSQRRKIRGASIEEHQPSEEDIMRDQLRNIRNRRAQLGSY